MFATNQIYSLSSIKLVVEISAYEGNFSPPPFAKNRVKAWVRLFFCHQSDLLIGLSLP